MSDTDSTSKIKFAGTQIFFNYFSRYASLSGRTERAVFYFLFLITNYFFAKEIISPITVSRWGVVPANG
jgi:hypothetical protein